MLKCLEEVSKAAQKFGGSLDSENTDPESGGSMIHVDAPSGYVWVNNGERGMHEAGADSYSSWWAEGCAEMIRRINEGVRVADPEEARQIEYDYDLPEGSWKVGGSDEQTNNEKTKVIKQRIRFCIRESQKEHPHPS